MNKLSRDKQEDILADYVERKGLRGLARTRSGNKGRTGKGRVSRTTVHALVRDSGKAAKAFLNARMRDLPCRVVEADEAYTYVGIRGVTLLRRKMKPKPGQGVFWIWIAIDADTKIVVAWRIGKRGKRDAKAFIADLKSRLKYRIQLTTDSHGPYFKAVEGAFGSEIDYVTVKNWEKRKKKKSKDDAPEEKQPPTIRAGKPDPARITTNHIENWFQKLRQNIARFSRRTTLYSKDFEALEHTVAIYIFYYNFIRRHETLGTTPAVAAGIEDTEWTWSDFIDVVEAARLERHKATEQAAPSEARSRKPKTSPRNTSKSQDAVGFVVFYSSTHDYVKIHRADCKHLRATPEKEGKRGSGHKYRCETIDEAENLAYDFVVDEVEACKVCLGRYSSLGYLGPRKAP